MPRSETNAKRNRFRVEPVEEENTVSVKVEEAIEKIKENIPVVEDVLDEPEQNEEEVKDEETVGKTVRKTVSKKKKEVDEDAVKLQVISEILYNAQVRDWNRKRGEVKKINKTLSLDKEIVDYFGGDSAAFSRTFSRLINEIINEYLEKHDSNFGKGTSKE